MRSQSHPPPGPPCRNSAGVPSCANTGAVNLLARTSSHLLLKKPDQRDGRNDRCRQRRRGPDCQTAPSRSRVRRRPAGACARHSARPLSRDAPVGQCWSGVRQRRSWVSAPPRVDVRTRMVACAVRGDAVAASKVAWVSSGQEGAPCCVGLDRRVELHREGLRGGGLPGGVRGRLADVAQVGGG